MHKTTFLSKFYSLLILFASKNLKSINSLNVYFYNQKNNKLEKAIDVSKTGLTKTANSLNNQPRTQLTLEEQRAKLFFINSSKKTNFEANLDPSFERECVEKRCTTFELLETIKFEANFNEEFGFFDSKEIRDSFVHNLYFDRYNQLYNRCKYNVQKLLPSCYSDSTLKCQNRYNDYKCKCLDGYYGKNCNCLDKKCTLMVDATRPWLRFDVFTPQMVLKGDETMTTSTTSKAVISTTQPMTVPVTTQKLPETTRMMTTSTTTTTTTTMKVTTTTPTIIKTTPENKIIHTTLPTTTILTAPIPKIQTTTPKPQPKPLKTPKPQPKLIPDKNPKYCNRYSQNANCQFRYYCFNSNLYSKAKKTCPGSCEKERRKIVSVLKQHKLSETDYTSNRYKYNNQKADGSYVTQQEIRDLEKKINKKHQECYISGMDGVYRHFYGTKKGCQLITKYYLYRDSNKIDCHVIPERGYGFLKRRGNRKQSRGRRKNNYNKTRRSRKSE